MIALLGAMNPQTRERTKTADTITAWLLDRVDASRGVGANTFSLHPAILQKYRENSDTYRNTLRVTTCVCDFAVISTIADSMDDDPHSRPSFKKPLPKPAPLKNVETETHVAVLARLVPFVDRMVYHCDGGAWHTTTELAHLCSVADGVEITERDIANVMTKTQKILRGLGAKTIFQTGRAGVTVCADWRAILASVRNRLDRVASLDWQGSTPRHDEHPLKSFTPVGLAILAYLDAQPTRSASITELAQFTDKHPATVRAAVDRMTVQLETRVIGTEIGQKIDEDTGEIQPVAIPKTLRPIVETGQNPQDRRETLITLPLDWKKRINECRQYLCTDGLNHRRNLHYAHERIARLRKILETARNPATIEAIERILAGAQKVLDWGTGKLANLHNELDRVESQIGVVDAPETPTQQPAPVVEQPKPKQQPTPRTAAETAANRGKPKPQPAPATGKHAGANKRVPQPLGTAAVIVERLHLGHLADPKFGTIEKITI